MGKDYRKDFRSDEEFKKEIKNYHETELRVALRLAQKYRNNNGFWPNIEPIGEDMSGSVSDSTVSCSADFKIGERKYEITHSRKPCRKYFHEKKYKIEKAIEKSYYLVFVDGIKTIDEPRYVALSPSQIQKFTDKSKKNFGTVGHPTRKGYIYHKPCFKFDLNWFESYWRKLPQLSESTIEQYSNLIKKLGFEHEFAKKEQSVVV